MVFQNIAFLNNNNRLQNIMFLSNIKSSLTMQSGWSAAQYSLFAFVPRVLLLVQTPFFAQNWSKPSPLLRSVNSQNVFVQIDSCICPNTNHICICNLLFKLISSQNWSKASPQINQCWILRKLQKSVNTRLPKTPITTKRTHQKQRTRTKCKNQQMN